MKKIEPLDKFEKEAIIEKEPKLLGVFAIRLRNLLIENNITSAELAKKAEISAGSITTYLNADRLPNAVILSDIAEFFKVSTDYLLGRSDVKSVNLTDDLINKYLGLSEGTIEKLKVLKDFSEEADATPLKAFNELMTNKITQKFFGVLGNYLFGEKVIEKISLIDINYEFSKMLVSTDSKSTTETMSIKKLDEKLSRSNLMELQEMLVLVKKQIEKRDMQ